MEEGGFRSMQHCSCIASALHRSSGGVVVRSSLLVAVTDGGGLQRCVDWSGGAIDGFGNWG
ncbi:hypothetical protein E2562_022012 [Oryza meyeriana var. granulata]|uniref:Uncharacterized protein n=1 Tax=Oryza meyeriana var. granulata TaxID=110450 RepID=A0A6G1ENH1_9ORYZ|nr:hypothetical protein E2562_022012 [Oryza meyeriana var. granulata]